jgi:PiT family inorganic phosphate transporter
MEVAIGGGGLLIVAALVGLYMAWAIGANDVANAMGTSVGSGTLTFKQAVIVAAIFEFAGAVIAGSSVSGTIRKGIVPPEAFAAAPEHLVYGMIASLLAAAVWLNIASRKGWPVSTTHSIVGAIVGFAVVSAGMDAVRWGKVATIMASWVVSPVLSGCTAFAMFTLLRKYVIAVEDPIARTKLVAPYLVFLTTVIIALVTLWKGLKHLDLHLGPGETAAIAIGLSVLAAGVAKLLIARIDDDPGEAEESRYKRMERIFGVLQIYTACAVAFAHGSNDVANAVGPMAAVYSTLKTGTVIAETAVPTWLLAIGAAGIVIGLATYGYRVIETIGKKITHLTPSRGYTAEFAAAVTIVIASRFGLPISTTHTLVGAVLGVGLARGLAATNLGTVAQIGMSWLVTLPAGAGLSILFYWGFVLVM